MIIVLKPDIPSDSVEVRQITELAKQYPDVRTEVHVIQGTNRSVTEIYLIGQTGAVPTETFDALPSVETVVRVKERYRSIGRHEGSQTAKSFVYNGVEFSQDTFHLFPGLCAVDNQKHVEETFAALQSFHITTARAGVYKPRTSPYEFQGLGKECLPYLFELAGKYGIRVIAMEVTHENQLEEIEAALEASGKATGVLLQIGTRNAQNFELLKAVGHHNKFPVLFKRGMGITLEESLNACEYVASAGNQKIIFCLRGMKTNLGDPHRNFVDFSHVPVIKRLTRLPVCIDPSHSVGKRFVGPDKISDISHVTAQGIIAGANAILVDFHPHPEKALCDGPQAIPIEGLEHFIRDAELVRKCYLDRQKLV
jgi:3-deoxy-7-phosphoheptulonate synthase